RQQAGSDRLALQMHRTGSALCDPASEFRARESEDIAQYPQERHTRRHIGLPLFAVHDERDHACNSRQCGYVSALQRAAPPDFHSAMVLAPTRSQRAIASRQHLWFHVRMNTTTATPASGGVTSTSAFWGGLWRTAGVQSVALFVVAYVIRGNLPHVAAFLTG